MTSAIEVIGPVPATAAYLCWVQRSIDRTGVFEMRIDGADTSAYRKVVASFKTAESLLRDDRVDIATQNRLIRINHANRAYTAWVQAALIKAGLLKAGATTEKLMELPLSATRQAIYRFQEEVYKKDGMKDGGLKPDGWVGPKTEVKLRKFSTTDPPGGDGTPAPCKPARPKPPPPGAIDDDLLIDKLRRARVGLLVKDKQVRDELECLQAFVLEALAKGRVDDRYWTFRVFDGWGQERLCDFEGVVDGLLRNHKQQSAVANFIRSCDSARSDDDVARCIRKLRTSVLCPLNSLLGWAFHQAALADAPIRDFPECAWLLELRAASQRRSPRSIYSCFATLIESKSGPCLT